MLRYILLILPIIAPAFVVISSEDYTKSFRPISHSCSHCTKRESLRYFQVCANCQNPHYCSSLCQITDWHKRHKDECGKKDRETELAYVKVKREKIAKLCKVLHEKFVCKLEDYLLSIENKPEQTDLLSQLREKLKLSDLPPIKENLQLADHLPYLVEKLELYGNQYRAYLLEESMSLIAQNEVLREEPSSIILQAESGKMKEEEAIVKLSEIAKSQAINAKALEIVLKLYFLSHAQPLIQKFPIKSDQVNHYFSSVVFYLQHLLPTKLEKEGNVGELTHHKRTVLPFLTTFEAYCAEGSLYRNKGYPIQIENCLDNLRRIVKVKCKQMFQARETPSILASRMKDFTIFWVYYIVCSIPCINLTKTQQFIDSSIKEEHSSMVSCLEHNKIMRYVFLTNNDFMFSVEKYVCSIEDFIEMIESPTFTAREVKMPDFWSTDFYIEGRDHTDKLNAFESIMHHVHAIPLSLAKLYYKT